MAGMDVNGIGWPPNIEVEGHGLPLLELSDRCHVAMSLLPRTWRKLCTHFEIGSILHCCDVSRCKDCCDLRMGEKTKPCIYTVDVNYMDLAVIFECWNGQYK